MNIPGTSGHEFFSEIQTIALFSSYSQQQPPFDSLPSTNFFIA